MLSRPQSKVERTFRHIRATEIIHIGKEANRWEEQFYLGSDPEAQIVYGTLTEDRRTSFRNVVDGCKQAGPRRVAQTAGSSHSSLSRLTRELGSATPRKLKKFAKTLEIIRTIDAAREVRVRSVLARTRDRSERVGIRRLALSAQVDPRNLAHVLAGRRKVADAMLKKLEDYQQKVADHESE